MGGVSTTEILADLIAFPTVSRDSNRALIDYCSTMLGKVGVSSQIIESEDGSKANLFATIGRSDQPGVMLSGHTDVVPVDGQSWTKPPFTAVQQDGLVYGRGSADMKGFVAAAMRAAVQATELELKTPLHLALSYDEEIGCVGVRSLISMLASAPVRPQMCIVGEPTGMAVATGHNIQGNARIDQTGMESCIGNVIGPVLHPVLGEVILNGSDLCDQVTGKMNCINRSRRQRRMSFRPNAVRFNGGFTLVPGTAAVKFEIRNLPVDSPDEILERLKSALMPAIEVARSRAPKADIRFEVTNAYPGLETPLEEDVVKFVGELTGRNDKIKVAFGTEGGLFSQNLGIPTIVCGPGFMDQGHKADEYVSLEQLARCDRMLAALNQRLVIGL